MYFAKYAILRTDLLWMTEKNKYGFFFIFSSYVYLFLWYPLWFLDLDNRWNYHQNQIIHFPKARKPQGAIKHEFVKSFQTFKNYLHFADLQPFCSLLCLLLLIFCEHLATSFSFDFLIYIIDPRLFYTWACILFVLKYNSDLF